MWHGRIAHFNLLWIPILFITARYMNWFLRWWLEAIVASNVATARAQVPQSQIRRRFLIRWKQDIF